MTSPASPTAPDLADVVDALTGIDEASPLDAARRRRPAAREHAQGSFAALFVPADAAHVSLAERAAVAANGERDLNPLALNYLNRLSDHLFVMTRHINSAAGGDILWKPGATR